MKRIALLFITVLLASPAFADQCDANIKKINESLQNTTDQSSDDSQSYYGSPSYSDPQSAGSTPNQDEVIRLQEKAMEQQAAGDSKGCVTTTSQALKLLQRTGG